MAISVVGARRQAGEALTQHGHCRVIRQPMFAALLLIWTSFSGHRPFRKAAAGFSGLIVISIRLATEARRRYPEYAEYSRKTRCLIPSSIRSRKARQTGETIARAGRPAEM